jgi:hypothetical protein
MRIRVSDPAEAADLSEFLRQRVNAIVEVKGARRQRPGADLEVSLLGSYGEEAMRAEIGAAVRRWAFVRRRPEPIVDP